MDLDELTVALARRMAAIVPAGFHVEAAEGMLWYSADEGRFPGQLGTYEVGRAGTYVRDNFNSALALACDPIPLAELQPLHRRWPQ